MDLMRGLDKEIEMPLPTTSGYNPSNNRDSSSPTLASTAAETSSDQHPQTNSDHYHLHHPAPSLPSNPLQQSQRNTGDPDPPSVTAITTVAGRSNPRPATATTIRYRECLKNHAASMGRHIVDGCGEFMPSGEEGTPQSLRCAACDCHRNFHRKETEGEPQTNVLNYYTYPPSKSNNGQSRILSPQFPPHPPLNHHHHQHMRFSGGSFPPLMMAFGGGGGAAESSSEGLNMFQCNDAGGQGSVQAAASSRKRFRTKFSQEQKDGMMEFAEKLGWRIQKHDEQEVQQFCNQVGVKRQVFKVWMHNNKQATKKKQM